MNDGQEIPQFDRKFFEGTEPFTRIGRGELGGKAQGLWRIRQEVLPRFEAARFPGVTVNVPTLTVITTELFDQFIKRNHLDEAVARELPDDRLAHEFIRAELPTELVGDLRALIAKVHQPLAVRSSSLLEDALEHPFAGVYATKMIPNNQFDADQRFRKLADAVKFVWASTYFSEAQSYLASIRTDGRQEKMAVILQEIVGERRGERFYPTLAGVARSYNYYPTGHARPKDGVVNLALGLGKTIVDGGLTWTYCPAFPKSPPPYNSIHDLLKNTQTEFWAVNMGKITAYDPTRETEYMFQHPLDMAEADDALRFLVSTYDGESDRLYPGMGQPGPRVLNFAPVLALQQPPLNDLIQSLLGCAEQALGAEVEVEFAVNLHPSKGLPARFGFLQVRPMAVSEDVVEVPLAELKGPGVVVASASVLGNGALDSIQDVVFLKPAAFAPECTPQMPAEIEGINRQLLEQRRPYLLIGFGRWGSSDPWLGVPVVWGQICGAKAIVEATLPKMSPDLGQGSHFFHNLIGFRVFYLSVPSTGDIPIDFTWLDAQPAVTETRFVKHVRTPAPLHIRVDGRSGRGVIRRE